MRLRRAMLWSGLGTFSAEHFGLWRATDGWRLDGLILLALAGRPTRVCYRVACSPAWATRSAKIAVRAGSETRRLSLEVDGGGYWSVDGTPRPDLANCEDVDLSVTPATNTLPVCRLGLAVGEARELVAAWVRFPELSAEPLAQRYTRLEKRRYRYESLVDGVSVFMAEIAVDDRGLVTHYAGGWECVAAD